jgi:hypothetical protein
VNARRLALYLGLLVLLAVLGYALVFWGLSACAPPPLPGDELWTMRQNAAQALTLVLRLGSASCFTADAGGLTALTVGTKTLGILAAFLALIVLWETAGREARRAWFRVNGGHVVLAGTYDDLRELMAQQARFAGTFFLAPDRAAAAEIARHRPFAEIVPLDARRLPQQLNRLGGSKARLLAAATRNDLVNVAIAEAGLENVGKGEVLVRLEQFAVRNLSSHRLRIRAGELNRPLAVVSLVQLQARRAAAAAMSGRYTVEGNPRVHIALCGSSTTMQAATFGVAREGFELERQKPLISILRTGSNDFAAGALDRLQSADIAEIRVADVPAMPDGLDRAIGTAVEGAPPLLAVHCIGDDGEAEALALRWEEVLLAFHQPVPPIIAYGSLDRPLGTTGMIRVATTDNLANAHTQAQLMDRRAMAVHSHFLANQRKARREKFGTAPAEVDWLQLPEAFQDDNRNVADQMDYKLARIFMLDAPGTGSATMTKDEIELLAHAAHSRWWAARAVAGWRFGKVRDDRLMLHPDMIPYDQLDEDDKQQDRAEVWSLPAMAQLAGERLRREHRIGLPRPLEEEAYAALKAGFARLPKDQAPVAVLPMDDAAMLRIAEQLIADGVLIEVLVDRWTEELRNDLDAGPRLANVLRRAWRIHVVRDDRARKLLADRVVKCVDENGGMDALE